MKNKLYLIIILIMVLNINLHSQDSEPSPLKFNYIINGNNITNQPLSSEYFQQKKFSLGAQWGAHSRMMKALDMNVNHGWQPHKGWTDSTVVSIADPNDSMKYIWYGSDFYDCRAFVFKPTLYIPIDKRGELITQAADTTKSVFGFSYLRDSNQVLSNPNNTRYNLYRDSINYIDSVVLANVWLDDGYKLALLFPPLFKKT